MLDALLAYYARNYAGIIIIIIIIICLLYRNLHMEYIVQQIKLRINYSDWHKPKKHSIKG